MSNLKNVSPEIVQAYQNEISRQGSPATAKRKNISLNKFFDWAEDQGHIGQNPYIKPISDVVVTTPKPKSKIDAKTWIVMGLTTSLVVLLFFLTWKVGFPIPFIRTPASEGIPESGLQTKLPQTSPTPFNASGAVNGAWNLYAKLKLTEGSGSPKVGSHKLSFKLFKETTGGDEVFSSQEQTITTDTNGSAMISLDNVPSSLFFENERLYLEPQIAGTPASARIPVNTANVSANLSGFPAANPTSGALPETIPVINSEGSLVFASESPAIKAPVGNLLIEGQTVTMKTADGSDGDMEFNPDGKGIAHFLFEGTKGDFLNAQGPNLTSGSLYYGMVPNNATGYKLINLQSGAPTMTTKFSVDALGNTYIGKDLNVKEDIATGGVDRLTSTGALTNITGYSQISGNFTIQQGAGDFASITKKPASGGALNDLLTLTLDERGKPTTSNSIYSTLVLNRYDGAIEAMALLVDNGNAQFDGQLRLGRFETNPTAIGTGSLIYNSTDNQIYIWNGTSWVTPSGSTSFASLTSGTNTQAAMVVGTGASLTYSGTGTINASTLNSLTSDQFLRSDTSDNFTSGTLTTDGGTTLDVNGELSVADTNIAFDGASTTFTTTGDLTLDIGGDQVIFADGDTINIGGLSGVSYNSMANAGDAPDEVAISSDNDLYIGGDLEVDGTIYGNITGSAGSVAWSGITSPTADLTLTMAGFNSTFNWDPGADSAETNWTLTTQGEDTVGSDEDQTLLALVQTSNGTDVSQAADALITLTNNDPNDPVVNAIRFDAGAAGTDFTFGINFDAVDIGTAEIVMENAEQIHNQSDGTITLEDGSGADYLSTNASVTTVSGDLAVNGAGSADITSTTTTATLFNSTVTTLDIGGVITTLNLGDAATTKTIDIGGVTSSGTDTINIATNSTAADTISIGNINASTVLNLAGGTVNINTNSTGDSELVVPNDSIGVSEINEPTALGAGDDEECLTYENSTGAFEFQSCSTGLTLPWSSLTDPVADLTLNHAAFNTVFNWDPGADSAETNLTLTTQGEDSGADEEQVLLALAQMSNGADVTQAADALLTFANNDANDPVINGIRFDAGAAGTDFTFGINFDAVDIGTAEIVMENAEQIHNQLDGTITLEDGSGADYLTTNSSVTTITGDLAVNGSTSADITSTTTTATLFNATVTTLDIGSVITTLNLGDAATTKTIDIGGVTSSGTDTINIATNSTAADTLNIGNINASTVLNLAGGTVNINTNSTGDSELVVPNDSIGVSEINEPTALGVSDDEECLTYENSTGAFEFQSCTAVGTIAWSSITDPITDLTLNHAAFNTTFNWDPGANSAETNLSLTTQGEDATGGGDEDQVLLSLSQSSNGVDTDEAADTLIALANNDANDAVNSGIRFDAGAGGTDFTYGINFDAADIGTAEIVLENGEQISNQADDIIVLEDDSGADYASFAAATSTINGILAANGGSITTDDTTFSLINTTATTLNFAGAATTLNIAPTGASGSIVFSGGASDTGCTLNGVTGDLTCSGNVSGTGNTQGFWQLNNKVISPANSTHDLAIGGTATASASFQAFGVEQDTGNVVKLTSDTITTGNIFEATASAITSGSMLKLGQGGDTSFTGNGLWMDFDNTGGGSFTGNFLRFDNAGSTVFTVSGTGDVTSAGDLAVNGGDMTSSATTFNLLNSTVTTLNFAGAATTLNIGPTGSGASTIAMSGGSADTGCTLDGSTGNFTCSGSITSTATSGSQGYWQLNDKVISPANSTHDVAVGGTATSSASFQAFGVETAGGDVARLTSDGVTTGNVLSATSSAITSGNMIKLGHGGNNGNFTGNGIYMDFNNTGGSSFTGNFLKFDNLLSTRFLVDSTGSTAVGYSQANEKLTVVQTAVDDLAGFYDGPDNLDFHLADAGVATFKPTAFTHVYNFDGAATYTNHTTEAKSNAGTPFTLLAAENPSNDIFYVGLDHPFATINVDIQTAASGVTLVKEYWNGSAWTALTVTDNTSDFTTDGLITFSAPTDWSITTVNSQIKYWVRFCSKSSGGCDGGTGTNIATAPTANFFTPTTGNRFYIYAQSGDPRPTFYVNDRGNVGIDDATPVATLTVGNGDLFQVAGATGNITTAGDAAINGGDITSTATTFNFDIGNTGDLLFRDGTNTLMQISDEGTTGRVTITDSLQVGHTTAVAYSRFGSSATDHAGTLSAANDVVINGDLEIDGGLYLDGKTIYNRQATAAILLCTGGSGASCETTSALQNTLSTGVWVIDNQVNVGEPALAVNNAKGGDLIVASASGTLRFRVENNGDVHLGNNAGTDLTVGGGTGKVDAGTVDPPYTINGKKFATFMAGMIGVKEEVTGLVNTDEYVPGHGYRTVIDFNNLQEGSDLWLFGKTTSIKDNIKRMVALLTPSFPTKVWYEVDEEQKRLVIYSAKPAKISYRLTAPRFDSDKWANTRDEGVDGFIINDKDTKNGNPVAVMLQNINDFRFDKVQDGFYSLKDKAGDIIDGVESIGTLVAGNIKVGALTSYEQVTEKLTAKKVTSDKVAVKLITPLSGDENVTLRIGSESTASGKLAIQNKDGEEVAAIDALGNANFKGDVHARNLDEMEEILHEVKLNQKLLSEAGNWNTSTATASSQLEAANVANLFVTNQAAINSLSVTSALTMGVDMVLQSRSDDNSFINSIDTLSAPLKLQSLAMADIEMMSGLVKIDTKGNVNIAGDLYVAGKVESTGIAVKNTEGEVSAQIDSTGSAQFATLTAGDFIVAGSAEATDSAVIDGVMTTNATAGSATINEGQTEITIKNPKVTDYSLVYVTPTSSTKNRVLYVKSKVGGKFVVGFSDPAENDVTFNWWIIQAGQ